MVVVVVVTMMMPVVVVVPVVVVMMMMTIYTELYRQLDIPCCLLQRQTESQCLNRLD